MQQNLNSIITKLNQSGANRLMASVGEIDPEGKTVELAFSSEEAQVPRFFGDEVLGHKPNEVNLSRLNDGGAVLVNHDADDVVGVVQQAQVDNDGVGRAVVRFGNSQRAQEIFQDVKDGIRSKVSVGYIVHDMKYLENRGDEDVYRVTNWEPTEVSIVSVPADPSVGVGRSASFSELKKPNEEGHNGDNLMNNPQENSQNQEKKVEQEVQAQRDAQELEAKRQEEVDVKINQTRENAIKQEQKRVSDIMELGRQYHATDLAAKEAQNPEGSLTSMQNALLERMSQKKEKSVGPAPASVGMTKRELGDYSLCKIARYLDDPSQKNRDAAGFEIELSQEAEKHMGRQKRSNTGIVVPYDVLCARRDVGGAPGGTVNDYMNTGSAGQTIGQTANVTIQTSVLASSYIDILFNHAIFARECRMLGGLVGNISIPRGQEPTQAYWVNEGEIVDPSLMKFDNILLSPHTVAANTVITRRLLMQSSMDVEALLRRDLAIKMALEIDKSGYYGTGGSKQPLGLANMPGLEVMNFAGDQPTFQELINMETEIAKKNADVEGMVFKANPSFRGYAKWQLEHNVNGSRPIWEPGNTVNGYGAAVSNQIAPTDLFFGNFNDVIMGMWGGLELIVDPYTRSTAGMVVLTTFQDIDWAFRHPQSFILGKSKPAGSTGGGSKKAA